MSHEPEKNVPHPERFPAANDNDFDITKQQEGHIAAADQGGE